MVLETIEYYKSKGSNVHVMLLDASKVFDKVNYIKLFDNLINCYVRGCALLQLDFYWVCTQIKSYKLSGTTT